MQSYTTKSLLVVYNQMDIFYEQTLDMYANFGSVVQIKHLSLDEELAENVVASITSDRIIIVCKSTEEKVINSLLTQIG